jgi:uncharacterized protein YjbJ (UPF0337 family)
MSGEAKPVKARAKEAAGALTGGDKRKREGTFNQMPGKAKQAPEKTGDRPKGAAKRIIGRAKDPAMPRRH